MVGQRSVLPEEIVLPADAQGMSEIRHELRTYLNHIIGYGEMVLEDAEDRRWSAGRRDMDDALSSARDLTEAISNVLRYLDTGDRAKCAEIVNTAVQPAILRIRRSAQHAASEAESAGWPEVSADIGRVVLACQLMVDALDRGLQPREESTVDRTPRIDPPPAEQPEAGDQAQPAAAAHVLAVDDNQASLLLLKRFCERRGHEVTTASTGEEALKKLKSRKFELVILDIMLPGMNGFEVLERIQESDEIDAPVIVLSSLDDVESMVTCLRLGAEDFLRKPFVADILEARIQAQLDKKRTAASATSGDSSSDAQRNPDGLSAREIEVLAHLAMGKSNREIGEDLFITENTVVRHVSNIFSKAGLANRAVAGVYAVQLGLVGWVATAH